MNYSISPNNLQLQASYTIAKKSFLRELAAIRARHPECGVWKRSPKSLVREWAAHNAFHALGIFPSRTCHTDLNWPQKWYFRIGYGVIAALVWSFIK